MKNYIETKLISSNNSIILYDDNTLLRYYNIIKEILLAKLNDNVLDLVIKFIDTRKRCIICKILFGENNISYEKCQDCN